jgi:PKD repeat protein
VDKLTLNGWNYRKSHIITSGTTLTNYQTKIRVYYGSGTDSGNTVYLNSKCNNDFSDIRFVTSDGSTLISYWIESIIAGDYADIWIKAPSISTTTIYIYYGNTSAISASSGDDTFEFFDDFSGTLLDTNKWNSNLNAIRGGTGNIVINNNLTFTQTSGLNNAGIGLLTLSPLASNSYRVCFKNTQRSTSYTYAQIRVILSDNSNPDPGLSGLYFDNYSSKLYLYNGMGIGDPYSLETFTLSTPTIYEFENHVTNPKAYKNEITIISGSGTPSIPPANYLQIWLYSTDTSITLSYLFARKYSAIEPTHSTWSAEELINIQIYANYTYSISNNLVTFTDTSSSTTPIISRLWDFGDGLIDDSSSVTHEYFAPATYQAKLSILNQAGLSDSTTKSIVIPNQSVFWPQSASILNEQFPTFEPCEVKFQGVSTPSKYTETTSYLWDFGDSTTSTLQDPFHVYESSGVKTISLTVSNLYGSKSTTTTIDVSANVKVYFSPNYRIGNNPLSVEFHDISVPQSEVLTRTWNFGDGSTSPTTTPTHQYTSVGTFSPSLTVTYHGGTKSLTKYNSMIVGIQTRTLIDEVKFSEAQEPLTIATFIDKIDFTEIVVPALMVFTDKLAYIQREIPLTRGILETGKTFAFHLTDIGRKVFNVFDSYGRKIIKTPRYENATGFYTCETILSFEDTLQFEEELTEQFPT